MQRQHRNRRRFCAERTEVVTELSYVQGQVQLDLNGGPKQNISLQLVIHSTARLRLLLLPAPRALSALLLLHLLLLCVLARVCVAVAVAATATIAIADQSWNAIASTLPRVLATLPAPQKSRVGAEIDCLFEFIYF